MKPLLSIFFSFILTTSFCQEYEGSKNLIGLSSGLSFMNFSQVESETNGTSNQVSHVTNLPVFGLFAERRLSEKIGIGVEFTFGLDEWESYDFYTGKTEISYSRIRIIPVLNVHFADIKNEKFTHDFYGSFGAGLKLADFSIRQENSIFGDPYASGEEIIFEFPVAIKAAVGYGLISQNGLMGKIELAIGGPFVNLGLGYKF